MADALQKDREWNVPEAIRSAVRRSFPEASWDEALATLPGPSRLPSEAPIERVLIAVVMLASGDLKALAHYCKRACIDWRDVLYWHEYPRDANEPTTWEEVSRRIGFRDLK